MTLTAHDSKNRPMGTTVVSLEVKCIGGGLAIPLSKVYTNNKYNTDDANTAKQSDIDKWLKLTKSEIVKVYE